MRSGIGIGKVAVAGVLAACLSSSVTAATSGQGVGGGSSAASRSLLTALRIRDGTADVRFRQLKFGESGGLRVWAVESDGRGGWFVGGDFGAVGGVQCANLAHVEASGQVDRRWCPQPNSSVLLMARAGDTLYVTGWFSRIGGVARNFLAAIDVRTGRPTSWQLRGAVRGRPNDGRGRLNASSAQAIAAGAGRVFLSGYSPDFLVGSHRKMVALDASTGRALSWDPQLDIGGCCCVQQCHVRVCAIAVEGNSVYVAGSFTHARGQRRVGLVALDAVTARPSSWQANVDDQAIVPIGGEACGIPGWRLATMGRTVYVGGGFSQINGVPRNGIAAVDARTGSVQSWKPYLPDSFFGTEAIGVSGSSVAIVYDYGVNYRRRGVRLVDRASGSTVRWARELPDGDTTFAAIAGGRVLINAGG